MTTSIVAVNQGTLSAAKSSVQLVLSKVADLLSADLEPDKLAVVFDTLKSWSTNVEDLTKVAKEKVKTLVHETGSPVGEAGSRELAAGDYLLEIRPSGGGVIAKRVEALIRAKGYDPATYMDSQTTYVFNPDKFKKLKLTDAERESCYSERTYAVQTPKRREDL